jgi:5-formyltetrahydrofolate cyclo-ligase
MTDDIMVSKRQALREEMKRRRSQMTPEQIRAASERIGLRIMELEPVKRALTLMGYSSIDQEVDVWSLLDSCQKAGKKILLPRVRRDKKLEAAEYIGREDLKPGAYGILEPTGAVFPEQEIDVVIVPGLVYDAKGYRLGYGAGYYDEFLPRLRKDAFACGVAFEFQVIDNTYPHQADVPVHWIVTEHSEVVINWDFF